MELIHIGHAPKIAVRSVGNGPLVIFLHGIGGSSLNWTAQLTALSPYYHAVAWDMRGYGMSEDYDGPFLLDDVTDDLRQVLDTFTGDSAHLVGLSMGGMIAVEFYRRFPDRVASLLLCNTNAGLGGDYTPEQKAEFIRLRKTPLVNGKKIEDIIPDILPALLGKSPSQEAIHNITSSLRLLRPDPYIKAIEAIMDFDCTDVLEHVTVPVQLIAGNEDNVTPAQTMATMCSHISGAQLTVIEQAGHLSNLEQPDEFNQILLEFIASVTRSAPPA